MNFLTLIFSFLLLLGFGTHLILEKQLTQNQLKSSYLGHVRAHRDILRQHEKQLYRQIDLPITPVPEKVGSEKKPKAKKSPLFNPLCARINILPLIREGKEKHPFLYELMLHILRTCYSPLFAHNTSFNESTFLNLFLKECGQFPVVQFEKLFAQNEPLRAFYYRMLKGSKQSQEEFPPLTDLIRADIKNSSICLVHAHVTMLKILFGEKIGFRLEEELKKESPTPLSREMIEHLYSELHKPLPKEELFAILAYRAVKQDRNKSSYMAHEDSVLLKKTICSEKKHLPSI